ncbi:MAG: lactate dehydrogenase [Deltaproteobacteria bacterium]|nr:lactate dehydrogenase [Deltaproteobacteria bacterium]
MKILFAAHEDSWGGFLSMIRSELPEHQFEATGRFGVDSLEGFDVLIPTMCSVTREVLETCDRLKLIQQCGSGLEGVDIPAARDRNIHVANVPTDLSGNAGSVAELGIYMLIGLSRDMRGMAKSLANRKMGEPQGRALNGKTVGLVGLGGIGQALISRLKPFGVRLMAIKRNHPEKAMKAHGLEWVGAPGDLPELLGRSDYVMLCLPVTSETRCLMNRETFSYMKPGAFLINLARGGLVDRDALEDALASGKIAGAGLDVFWEEPPDPDDPIFSYNVLATPHIGGSTDVSMRGIVKAVAENIRRIESNLKPLHLKI